MVRKRMMTANEYSASQELLERLAQPAGDPEGLSWHEDEWLAEDRLGVHPDHHEYVSDELLEQIMQQADPEGIYASAEMNALLGIQETGETPQQQANAVQATPDMQFACAQLLAMVTHGSPDVKMAALRTLRSDFHSQEAVAARSECVRDLLNVLAIDDGLNPSSEIQVDWKSAVWKLLFVILGDMDALGLRIGQAEVASVLTLVQRETRARYRRMALRFLLVRASRRHNSVCQETIVQSEGGISLLVHALSTERDQKASQLLLKLLGEVAAASSSAGQVIDSTVQMVVIRMDPDAIEFTNLLLLIRQAQAPEFARTAPAATRKQELDQLVLQAAIDTLSLASSSVLHKSIALNWVRQALPEIGFAFVFDFEGIPLLSHILVQSESSSVHALAVDILRWLAHEDVAFRDYILELYSEDTAAQDPAARLRAVSIRKEILELSRSPYETCANTDAK